MKRNLLFALSAFLPFSAFSAVGDPIVYNEGDLLVAFRLPATDNGQGNSSCYVADIGSAAGFRDGNPTGLSSINLNADLTAVFGADWYSRVIWSAAETSYTDAVAGDPAFALYLSRPEDTPGTPSPFSITAPNGRKSVSTLISGAIDPGLASAKQTANNPGGTTQGIAEANGWRSYMSGGSNTDTNSFRSGINAEGNASQSLSLFRMLFSTVDATYTGHLTLSSSGGISFTPASPVTTDPYTTWAATNVGGQTYEKDFDGDGLSNGLEYFMGTAPNAATARPSVVVSGGVSSITWPRSTTATVPGFKVETSPDLVTWTDATASATVTASSIAYTLPAGQAKSFVRLNVTFP